MAEHDITAQLTVQLKQYSTEIGEAVDQAGSQCARAAAKELRQTSPRRTGNYRKDWTSKKTADRGTGRKSYTVYNRKHYQLTHLLEHEHRARGKKQLTVPAHPHIKRVEEKWTKEYEAQCEEVCANAGK